MSKEKKDNVFVKFCSYLWGTNSKTMYITIRHSKEQITVPWLLAVLCLLVFDIPSWVLAILLIMLLVFDLDLNIVDTNVEKKVVAKEPTVKTTDYSRKKINKKIKVDDEGFSEIIIN